MKFLVKNLHDTLLMYVSFSSKNVTVDKIVMYKVRPINISIDFLLVMGGSEVPLSSLWMRWVGMSPRLREQARLPESLWSVQITSEVSVRVESQDVSNRRAVRRNWTNRLRKLLSWSVRLATTNPCSELVFLTRRETARRRRRRCGHSTTTRTDKCVVKARELSNSDRRLMAQELNLSKSLVTDDLRKMWVKMVLKILSS